MGSTKRVGVRYLIFKGYEDGSYFAIGAFRRVWSFLFMKRMDAFMDCIVRCVLMREIRCGILGIRDGSFMPIPHSASEQHIEGFAQFSKFPQSVSVRFFRFEEQRATFRFAKATAPGTALFTTTDSVPIPHTPSPDPKVHVMSTDVTFVLFTHHVASESSTIDDNKASLSCIL